MKRNMECYDEKTWWLFYDGTLDAEEADGLNRHLRQCDQCRQRWADVQALARVLEAMRPDAASVRQTSAKVVTDFLWRRRAKRVAAVFALAAGFILAVGVIPGFFRGAPPAAGPEVETANGDVEEIGPALAVEDRGPGARRTPKEVRRPTVREVDEDSPATPSLRCGGTYQIADARFLQVVKDEKKAFVARLTGSEAHFTVPSDAGVHFTVETPDMLVKVMGTIFTVAYDGTTSVRVKEGTVQLFDRTERPLAILTRGQSYPEQKPPVPAGVVPPRPGLVDVPANATTVKE